MGSEGCPMPIGFLETSPARPFLMVGLTQFLDSFLSYHPSLAVKGEVIMMRNTSPTEVKLYLERMPLPKNNQTVLVKNKGVWNRVGIMEN